MNNFIPFFPSKSRWLAIAMVGLALTCAQAVAANRVVKISAPASAEPETEITVPIAVTTDAGGGEQIGFIHADYSIDGGTTWTGFCYAQNVGPTAKQAATFKTGPVGSKAVIRVRVAFRGGRAGDVDFNGKAIDWSGTWELWRGPPTKYVIIPVVGK